jgi:hypothetical protein
LLDYAIGVVVVLKGEKTRIYWWGLFFLGIAVVILFTSLWYSLVVFLNPVNNLRSFAPMIFGGIVFILIGIYMMISGVKKEKSTE